MATLAVVGATGQIGSEVVRLLHEDGHGVRALVREAGRARPALPSGVELIQGDLRDAARHPELLAGVDALFVVSSDPALEPPILRSAGETGVPLVVKSSALGPGGAPPRGHAAAEEVLRRQPVASVVLRPNAFMQTLRGYLPRLLDDDGTFALPAGDGASAWVDTRDIAAVAAAVLTSPPPDAPAAYVVTGPAALTMRDVADVVSANTDRRVRYRPVSPAAAAPALADRLGPMGGFLVEHYAAVVDGDFAEVATTVPELTGRPARSLDALVREDPQAWVG